MTRILGITAIVAVIVFGGCFDQFTVETTLNFNFGGSGERSVRVPEGMLSQLNYTIRLSKDGEYMSPIEVDRGKTFVSIPITAGFWNIEITARLGNKPYAEGSSWNFEVFAGKRNAVVITMSVIEPYSIYLAVPDIDPEENLYTFPSLAKDYEEDDIETLTVTVHNSGNLPTGNLAVTLEDNDDVFESDILINSIAVGSSESFGVKPVSDLPSGTYTATVKVTNDNGIAESFNISFWVKEIYTVTFNIDGGDGPDPDSQQVTEGDKVEKPTNPSKIDYYFVHWYDETNGDEDTAWDFNNDTVTNNMTLKAFWTNAAVYTVTFDSTGGTAVQSQNIIDSNKASKPTNPTMTNYAVVGWYKEATLNNEWDFDNDTVTNDITLYAKWAPTYIVVFNRNSPPSTTVSGNTGTMANRTYTQGIPDALPNNTFVRPGYSFKGWSTATSPGINAATNYDNSAEISLAEVTPGQTLTLYAVWTLALNVGSTGPGGGRIYYRSDAGFTVQGYSGSSSRSSFPEYRAHYLEIRTSYINVHNQPDPFHPKWQDFGLSQISGITTINRDLTNTDYNNIGNGRKDTSTIITYLISADGDYQYRAPYYAGNFSSTNNGITTSDWFMPSLGELYFLRENRTSANLQSIFNGFQVWSSTQVDSPRVWTFAFDSNWRFWGEQKTQGGVRVYPVRAF